MLTWFMEHDKFKMLFVSFINRRFTKDISSQGKMSQMKTLIGLFPCLKQLTILIRSLRLFSVEYWYKVLVIVVIAVIRLSF